jgi:hypothetical protein
MLEIQIYVTIIFQVIQYIVQGLLQHVLKLAVEPIIVIVNDAKMVANLIIIVVQVVLQTVPITVQNVIADYQHMVTVVGVEEAVKNIIM